MNMQRPDLKSEFTVGAYGCNVWSGERITILFQQGAEYSPAMSSMSSMPQYRLRACCE